MLNRSLLGTGSCPTTHSKCLSTRVPQCGPRCIVPAAVHHASSPQQEIITAPEAAQQAPLHLSRRTAVLGSLMASLLMAGSPAPAQAVLAPPVVQIDLTPDQSKYDPTDPDLRAAANLLQEGLNATDVETEEATWTRIIDTYGNMDKPWVPDVVGRAWGNRGNARSRQGKLQEALQDYNKAISICPWSVDPVLNRGVVLEALGRFEEAVTDYRAVLAAAPNDPAGWNNLGNATMGLGQYADAITYYTKAASMSPVFSFAAANRTLALYQVGERDQAVREMRTLLRKYPGFTDMRAGLAAALWGQGLEGQAETQWERVDDPRYKDAVWLKENRRWPPALRDNLASLLQLKSVQ